jgi:hypothetical protein
MSTAALDNNIRLQREKQCRPKRTSAVSIKKISQSRAREGWPVRAQRCPLLAPFCPNFLPVAQLYPPSLALSSLSLIFSSIHLLFPSPISSLEQRTAPFPTTLPPVYISPHLSYHSTTLPTFNYYRFNATSTRVATRFYRASARRLSNWKSVVILSLLST